jgi:hypothetical protein
MAKLTKRTKPLAKEHQREFVTYHIPQRIKIIETCLLSPGAISYEKLTAAAIFTRAIAGFLGLGCTKGKLQQSHAYFQHQPGQSWEVKLSDINGGSCLTLQDLSADEQAAIEAGINETNLAFAHLTYWDAPTVQDSLGRATDAYNRAQVQRIQIFAETVIALFRRVSAGLPK